MYLKAFIRILVNQQARDQRSAGLLFRVRSTSFLLFRCCGVTGGQDRGQDGGPEAVAFVVEVEAVGLEEFGAGLVVGAMVGSEHGGGDVDEVQARGGSAAVADEGIGGVHLGPEVPAGQAGLDGNIEDGGPGQGTADFGGEVFKVGQEHFGGFAGGDVVVAGVQDDGAGGIGEDDAVGVIFGIDEEGAAEAAVDGSEVGEGFLGIPQADAGAAYEEDRVWRRGLLGVETGEVINIRLPALGVGVISEGLAVQGDLCGSQARGIGTAGQGGYCKTETK